MQPAIPSKISQFLEPQASEYIGYSIPPRVVVVSLLGGYVAAFFVLGTSHAARRPRQETPGLAEPRSGDLRRRVTADHWSGQSPHSSRNDGHRGSRGSDLRHRRRSHLRVRSPCIIPSRTHKTIGTTHGGRLLPDMSGLGGSIKRLVWKDIDTWNWENLALGAGERLATFVQSTMSSRAVRSPRHSARGAVGAPVDTRISTPGDALLATRLGRMGVTLQSGGEFLAAAESVFGADQYLAADLLSDEQDRRRRTYAEVLPEQFRRILRTARCCCCGPGVTAHGPNLPRPAICRAPL